MGVRESKCIFADGADAPDASGASDAAAEAGTRCKSIPQLVVVARSNFLSKKLLQKKSLDLESTLIGNGL